MKYITPDIHPSHAATITASPDTIIEAAKEAFKLIHLEQFPSVTVHMPEDLVEETVRIAAQNPHIRDNRTHDIKFKGDEFADARNDDIPISLRDIEKLYGPNYLTMLKFCAALGPGTMRVSSKDGRNNEPHIDTLDTLDKYLSAYFSDLSKVQKAPQERLTVTMSQIRDGTGIIPPLDNEIRRYDDVSDEIFELTGKRYPSDSWNYSAKSTINIEERTVYSRQNTITVMRSRHWPESHLPSLHKAAERKDDGNPYTGIIGRASICPYLKPLNHQQT
jgi:hypothetical protein